MFGLFGIFRVVFFFFVILSICWGVVIRDGFVFLVKVMELLCDCVRFG